MSQYLTLYIYIFLTYLATIHHLLHRKSIIIQFNDFPKSQHLQVGGRFPMAEEYYPTWQRQRLLLHGFNFHCRCERCCGCETPELCCAFRCPECEVGLVGLGWVVGWLWGLEGWGVGGVGGLGGLEEIFFLTVDYLYELKIHGSHGSLRGQNAAFSQLAHTFSVWGCSWSLHETLSISIDS